MFCILRISKVLCGLGFRDDIMEIVYYLGFGWMGLKVGFRIWGLGSNFQGLGFDDVFYEAFVMSFKEAESFIVMIRMGI